MIGDRGDEESGSDDVKLLADLESPTHTTSTEAKSTATLMKRDEKKKKSRVLELPEVQKMTKSDSETLRQSTLGEDSDVVAQLSSYVARFVLDRYRKNLKFRPIQGQWYCETFKDTAVMIADVSGFTRMNESFAELGESGAEKVTKHLNVYFSRLLRIIDKHGGDCVKFAGDALIVIFRQDICRGAREEFTDAKNETQLLSTAECTLLRAVQAAIELSREPAYVVGKVTLTLHTAVGFSDVYAMHLGGNDNQWEFLVGGDAFRQLGSAVDASKRGDVVVSKEAWDYIRKHCRGSPVDESKKKQKSVKGYVTYLEKIRDMKILNVVHPVSIVSNPKIRLVPMMAKLIERYVPIPVRLKFRDGITNDKWLAELRRATAIFINLKVKSTYLSRCPITHI